MPRFLNVKDIPAVKKRPHIGRYKRMLRDALSNPALTEAQKDELRAKLNALGGQKPYATLRATREARAAELLADMKTSVAESGPSEVQQEVVATTVTTIDDLLARTKDELGDLSRSISSMLQRLNQHTRYLERMPDTLAHELSNPLNVVNSSIDNS